MPKALTENGTNLRSIGADQTAPRPTYPKMPRSLPAHMLKEWKDLIAYLRQQETYDERKLGLVEAYLGNLNAVRQASKALDDYGLILDTGKENPASTLLSRHTAMLTKCATLLGLTAALKVQPQAAAPKGGSAWSL